MKTNQLIIIGGGASILDGLCKFDRLQNKFVIGTNYSHKFIKSTFTCCVDSTFYNDNFQELSALPLVVCGAPRIKQIAENTIALKTVSKYDPTLKTGVYKSNLTGIYTLSIADYLLQGGEIFLLGYDFGVKVWPKKHEIAKTHFYQGQIEHRGIGKVNYYATQDKADKDFDVFKNAKSKIYNVSPDSNINTFEKISYDRFFELLDKDTYNQDTLRLYVKYELTEALKQ